MKPIAGRRYEKSSVITVVNVYPRPWLKIIYTLVEAKKPTSLLKEGQKI